MVSAIETVRGAIAQARARPGRLRGTLLGGAILAAILLGVFWLPGALTRQTAALVPETTRVEIGQMVLADLTRLTGMPCDTPLGGAAADRLAQRVLGTGGGPVLVMRDGVKGALALPGGFMLLARGTVEQPDGPEVAAGYILAERLRAAQADPLVPVLRHAGVVATLRLLATAACPPARSTALRKAC